MTNTSGEVRPHLQTLHTFHVQHKNEMPVYQVETPTRIELGKKVLYSITQGKITARGIFDTLTGVADVDVRDSNGQLVVHGEGIGVDRIGLKTFDDHEVTSRSLAQTAGRALAWAELFAVEPSVESEQNTAA